MNDNVLTNIDIDEVIIASQSLACRVLESYVRNKWNSSEDVVGNKMHKNARGLSISFGTFLMKEVGTFEIRKACLENAVLYAIALNDRYQTIDQTENKKEKVTLNEKISDLDQLKEQIVQWADDYLMHAVEQRVRLIKKLQEMDSAENIDPVSQKKSNEKINLRS